mmetsp:Transcript_103675/g.317442  ORF Transcript_103675/g.317442 Transcript_103675/m.317442 type:complete len:233 (+) Transcript_103675:2360-3058(+)
MGHAVDVSIDPHLDDLEVACQFFVPDHERGDPRVVHLLQQGVERPRFKLGLPDLVLGQQLVQRLGLVCGHAADRRPGPGLVRAAADARVLGGVRRERGEIWQADGLEPVGHDVLNAQADLVRPVGSHQAWYRRGDHSLLLEETALHFQALLENFLAQLEGSLELVPHGLLPPDPIGYHHGQLLVAEAGPPILHDLISNHQAIVGPFVNVSCDQGDSHDLHLALQRTLSFIFE